MGERRIYICSKILKTTPEGDGDDWEVCGEGEDGEEVEEVVHQLDPNAGL